MLVESCDGGRNSADGKSRSRMALAAALTPAITLAGPAVLKPQNSRQAA